MYSYILILHGLLRWLMLGSLLFALYRAYTGLLGQKPFTATDNKARVLLLIFSHIQLIVGLLLYLISPLTEYFLHNFKDALKDSDVRYFGLEHSVMMIVAIMIITLGAMLVKRKTEDTAKFRTMAIWFTLAALIVLAFIPWPFSPMAARPFFRLG